MLISGSAMLYELPGPEHARGAPVPDLEANFPGIRRVLHEGHLRYTFVRFGAPYVLSLECFDGPRARFRLLPCKQADRVIIHVLTALRVGRRQARRGPRGRRPGHDRAAGDGLVQVPLPSPGPAGAEQQRPQARRQCGQYGLCKHPLPAGRRSRARQLPGLWSRSKPISKDDPSVHTWRDNFCERRGFRIGQCPGGIGHQGQDIRPPPC